MISSATATVASLSGSADQQELIGKAEERYAASEEKTRPLLKLLLQRLAAIEERLDQNRA